MPDYKVIHQVTPNKFEVKHFTASSIDEYNNKRTALGTTFEDINTEGWTKRFYEVGMFTILWRTNFNYGRMSFANAHILYNNEVKGTRVYLKQHDNINRLEDVANLMNIYSNLSADETLALFVQATERLAMYRVQFVTRDSYELGLEKGFSLNSYEELPKGDLDRQCIHQMRTHMEAAVNMQIEVEHIRKISNNIDEALTNDENVDKVKTRISLLNDKHSPIYRSYIWNGNTSRKYL